MLKPKRNKNNGGSSGLVRGMFKVHLHESGPDSKVVGDSGWCDNIIVSNGIDELMFGMGLGVISDGWNHLSIGTGGVPAWGATQLPGEEATARQSANFTTYLAATPTDSVTPSKVIYTATFPAGFITAAHNISNIGLFMSATGNELVAGNTYASSACATNQAVTVTYEIKLWQP